jgi:hypothetical protein
MAPSLTSISGYSILYHDQNEIFSAKTRKRTEIHTITMIRIAERRKKKGKKVDVI